MKIPSLLLVVLMTAHAGAFAQGTSTETSVVVATDFAFAGPTVVPQGAHTFLMVNRGKELHMMEVTRLEQKRTASDAVSAWNKNQATPWAVDVGGPNMVAPGDTSNATVLLEPGRYMLSCWIVAKDGKLHVMKGMFSEFEVRPVRVRRKVSKPDVNIVLSDFNIDVRSPISRGKITFRVENKGPNEHDVQLLKIRSGFSVRQVLDWMETPGASTARMPALPMGGVVGMNSGKAASFTANLARGDYLLLCYVPDSNGKPHFRHGMTKLFSIK
ncbi:MAG: hypothetical protein H0U64_04550 [Gemmatimonadaceae bacterium]|nr:hypothetical protein [Gemmatimonadaceae bacterium]